MQHHDAVNHRNVHGVLILLLLHSLSHKFHSEWCCKSSLLSDCKNWWEAVSGESIS